MVEGADDAASKVEENNEVHAGQGEFLAYSTDVRQEERHHDRGEDFKKTLDPQVDDPPPPVFGIRKVAPLAVHESGHIEQRNGDRAVQEHVCQAPGVLFILDGGADRSPDKDEPDNHPGNQQELPHAAQFDEFVSLVPEQIPVSIEIAGYGKPGASERACHHHDQRPEEDQDPRGLPPGFLAHERADEKPGREEAGCNEENGQLDMPGSDGGIRQEGSDRNAVERVAFHGKVGRNRTEPELEGEQHDGRNEVHQGGFLARSRLGFREIEREMALVLLPPDVPLVHKQGCCDAENQQNYAHDGPDEKIRQRDVPDQRIEGPVGRIGVLRARTPSARCPRKPCKEDRYQAALCFRPDDSRLQSHAVIAFLKQLRIVAGQRVERLGLVRREDQCARLGSKTVLLDFLAHEDLQTRLVFRRQLLEVFLGEVSGLVRIEAMMAGGQVKAHSMEEISGPVRGQVGPMPPDGSDMLSSAAVEIILSVNDFFAGEQDGARLVLHLFRNGRFFFPDRIAAQNQDPECQRETEQKNRPHLWICHLVSSLNPGVEPNVSGAQDYFTRVFDLPGWPGSLPALLLLYPFGAVQPTRPSCGARCAAQSATSREGCDRTNRY